MSTEQKNADQNALASRFNTFWGEFKQGKIVGYKWMAIILIAVSAIGVTWYILSERKKASSRLWMGLDEANTATALDEYAKANPNTVGARLALLQIARNQLGESGIDLLNSPTPEVRQRAVESIEKARESFKNLLGEFKDDPVFKAECLLGLAKAEAALVAVPTREGQQNEFRGKVPTVIEYLDQLSEAAAPDTPWATDSKKLADSLRKDDGEFVRVQRALYEVPAPVLSKGDNPFGPIAPAGPGGAGGGTLPILPGGK